MTISSTTNKVQYTGNAVTTTFSFPYVFFTTADLTVTLYDTTADADVSPAPVLNGSATYDYTISGVFDAATGEYTNGADVVFNTAPPANYRITIERIVSPTQLVALVDGSRFPAATVNGEFDKLTILIQRAYQLIAQALYYPSSDPPTVSNILPADTVRANMYLGFDASGNPVALDAPAGTTAVSSFWAPILLLTTAALSRLSLGFSAIAAKGDLFVGTALNTIATLTVGANGKFPMANSAATPGITWVGPFYGYIGGLITSRGSTTTIGVSAGACMDSTNVMLMAASAGTINLATTGANGLDTGALAVSTSYHNFVIGKTDGTTAFLTSTSPTAPVMPATYTLLRRIGSFRSNGSSQVTPFFQFGDLFTLDVAVLDVNTTNPGTAAILSTISVPTGVRFQAWVNAFINNASNGNALMYLSDPATTDAAASSANITTVGQAAAGTSVGATEAYVVTDTSARIRYRLNASGASDVARISTKGWRDRRGQDG